MAWSNRGNSWKVGDEVPGGHHYGLDYRALHAYPLLDLTELQPGRLQRARESNGCIVWGGRRVRARTPHARDKEKSGQRWQKSSHGASIARQGAGSSLTIGSSSESP